MTIINSGFPGIGKSYFYDKNLIVDNNWGTWINDLENMKPEGFKKFKMIEGSLSILIEMEFERGGLND